MKRLILDIDDTISITKNGEYHVATPVFTMIEKVKEYKKKGFEIVFFSSRNMRTYEGNVGKINANTLPVIINWLNDHGIPYDEIYVGKPWCGFEGFYVDDKAVRPAEFVSLSYNEIMELLEKDKLIN
jgi:capsule biosynthesis phosphatase